MIDGRLDDDEEDKEGEDSHHPRWKRNGKVVKGRVRVSKPGMKMHYVFFMGILKPRSTTKSKVEEM